MSDRKIGKAWWVGGVVIVALTGGFAWFRSGALDLPAVPAGLNLQGSGLDELSEMKQLNDWLWADGNAGSSFSESAQLVKKGIQASKKGETQTALEEMRAGVRLEPNNLVLANAYRMVVFGLRRDFLAAARRDATLAPQFPQELERQPILFFESLEREHHTRETRIHLALAWVDEMLLFPALEIKAPASVQAVDLLTQIIEQGNPGYVPALFARGLNHLHRPARLVWPESAKTRSDAAVQDVGRCVTIGRKYHVGSARLQAQLAMTLGDAYVKTGRYGVARSWWQVAQNISRAPDLQEAIRRRYSWQNQEMLDRLEAELDRGRSELQHPMTDLALMWN